jgi:NarL family two-component system sensor histidine kinase YdfH
MAMKQFIRSIHPLCWFLLVFLVWGWINYLFHLEWHHGDLLISVFFTILCLIHIGIYWLGFSRLLKNHTLYLLLLVQAAFVVLGTQISQDLDVTFVLSLVLIAAFIDMLRQVRPILLATSMFLAVMLLYANTPGSQLPWNFLWRGDNAVFEIPMLLIVTGIIIYQQQKRAHERTRGLLRELNIAHAQLSSYALRVEELTALTERQRIARDLHDTLVQGLAGLVMQLDVVNIQLQEQRVERAQAFLPDLVEVARSALMDARCALGDLRSGNVRPDDLVEVIQEEVARFTVETEIACQVSLEPLLAAPARYCEHIVRVVDEALMNIKRHAQAKHVWIEARHEQESLLIEIRDDGRGFDPALASTKVGHYGLLGIRERAKLIGGSLELQSQSGQGTLLRLCLPLSGEGVKEAWSVELSVW